MKESRGGVVSDKPEEQVPVDIADAEVMVDGVSVWPVDLGETERIAARSREEAIDWYLHNYPGEWPREEIGGAFDEGPTPLTLTHWKDVHQQELGKQTLRDSLAEHLAAGGEVPFLISTTCW